MRVLILSADIGEGHDLPARMLAAELRREHDGVEVTIADGVVAMGRIVALFLRSGSEIVLGRLPWLFDLQYWSITRCRPVPWVGKRLLLRFGSGGVLELVRRHHPDVIVSTYPGVTELLGGLRERGRLGVPVCSAITDLAGLRYWANPGVDLHLVTHRESIEEVEQIAGTSRVCWVRGLNSPEFLAPREPLEARRALGLPEAGPVVVVSGGGWALGDLVGATEVALGIPDATVVCLCGRNGRACGRLERRFAGNPRVRVLGFTDRMSDVLAAGDALVHSTAGLTVLEAHQRGCPPISYGWAFGHIRANNRAFARFGLAEVATSRAQLDRVLRDAVSAGKRPPLSLGGLPSAASLVLALGASG